jgi:hypothetical protein
MLAVTLISIFGAGFLLGYLAREVISQLRRRRALKERRYYEMGDLNPPRRNPNGVITNTNSPPLSPSTIKSPGGSSKQSGSSATGI